MTRFLAFAFLLAFALPQAALADVEAVETECWISSNMVQDVDCYHVFVPLDRANPSNGTVRLAVAVLRSSSSNPAPDPVIYMEGGPGAPTFVTDYPDYEDYSDFWWEHTTSFRRTRDFILFDQRGIGLSRPSLDCPELHDLDQSLPPILHFDHPLIERETSEMAKCYARLRADGVPLEQFDTRNSADDVADIVRALGYEQVNLYGASYGTRLGLEVMRRHPDLVRSAVLDGVYPPTIDPELDFPRAVAGAFANLFEDCERDPGCRRIAPDVAATFERLITDLNERPRELELYDLEYFDRGTFVRFDGNAVASSMVEYLYDSYWLTYIPLMIGTAADGDLDALSYFYWPASWGGDGMDEGVFVNVECREAPTLDMGAMREEAERYGIYGEAVLDWSLVPYCDAWPVASDPLDAEGPVVSDVPTLLLSGRYDPVTPASYAEEAAETLSNNRHLIFRSGGHAVTFWYDCALKLAAKFIAAPDPDAIPVPRCRDYTDPADFAQRF
jgi:pimeloyl-ACP methyl ester carboxylesterase